jgi:hypothetical protein
MTRAPDFGIMRAMSIPNALMPLRIPTCWAVRWNGFFEHEDEDCVESEDLLWLERIDPKTGASTGPFIDLGWYGSREGGVFRLVLMQDDWDHEVKRFESRDRYAIVRELEHWLPKV